MSEIKKRQKYEHHTQDLDRVVCCSTGSKSDPLHLRLCRGSSTSICIPERDSDQLRVNRPGWRDEPSPMAGVTLLDLDRDRIVSPSGGAAILPGCKNDANSGIGGNGDCVTGGAEGSCVAGGTVTGANGGGTADGAGGGADRCKDYFVADVGHVRRRDSVVGSRSRGRARRREGRPRSAVGDEERKRETRRAQNRTQGVTGVLFNCLATYTGISYILRASRCPCGTYKAGQWLCAPSDSELGTRNSELGTPSLGLGVPLGSAEHGGRVARGLRGTLDIDPNPNGIVPLQRCEGGAL